MLDENARAAETAAGDRALEAFVRRRLERPQADDAPRVRRVVAHVGAVRRRRRFIARSGLFAAAAACAVMAWFGRMDAVPSVPDHVTRVLELLAAVENADAADGGETEGEGLASGGNTPAERLLAWQDSPCRTSVGGSEL